MYVPTIEGLSDSDFVSCLPPLESNGMSRDEFQGSVSKPLQAPLKEVGMCRHCGEDVPMEQWLARGKRCARC